MASLSEYLSSRAKKWSAELWDGLINALEARFKPLEEQLDVQRATTDAIVARGLQVIDDALQPIIVQSGEELEGIQELRQEIEDLLASLSGGTAADAERLGGELPAYYLSLSNSTGTLSDERLSFTPSANGKALIASNFASMRSLLSVSATSDIAAAIAAAVENLVTTTDLSDGLDGKENADTDILKRNASQALTKGFPDIPQNWGSKSGSITPSIALGHNQYCIFDGVTEIAISSDAGEMSLDVTIGAGQSGVGIDLTAYGDNVFGDDLSDVAGDKFTLWFRKGSARSSLYIEADAGNS